MFVQDEREKLIKDCLAIISQKDWPNGQHFVVWSDAAVNTNYSRGNQLSSIPQLFVPLGEGFLGLLHGLVDTQEVYACCRKVRCPRTCRAFLRCSWLRLNWPDLGQAGQRTVASGGSGGVRVLQHHLADLLDDVRLRLARLTFESGRRPAGPVVSRRVPVLLLCCRNPRLTCSSAGALKKLDHACRNLRELLRRRLGLKLFRLSFDVFRGGVLDQFNSRRSRTLKSYLVSMCADRVMALSLAWGRGWPGRWAGKAQGEGCSLGWGLHKDKGITTFCDFLVNPTRLREFMS